MTEQQLQALYGLPQKVTFCRRCVMSNQRPSSTVEFKNPKAQRKETIVFDEDGVCSACRYADVKEAQIDWREREQELIKLCNEYRSKKGYYDCIVPGSGGKDSSFTSHILKYKYGMHPLTVTWAPHIYTDVGFKNFQKWIHSGMDNILFTPNGKLHRLLTRLAFENLLHPFQPFIIGLRHVAPKFSTRYNIPLIFYGENQAEYGNNINDNFRPTMDPKFFQVETGIDELLLSGIPARELMREHNVEGAELLPYLPAAAEETRAVGTVVHYLGYYLKWDPQECYYYASRHTGMMANDERTEGTYSKYASIDDRVDNFHYYTTFIKFGIGRATYDAAQEIRNNKITREEAVALVKRYDHEFPSRYFREFLDYMEMDEQRFHEIIDKGRSPHLWKLEGPTWTLRHAVWMDEHVEAARRPPASAEAAQ